VLNSDVQRLSVPKNPFTGYVYIVTSCQACIVHDIEGIIIVTATLYNACSGEGSALLCIHF
jgi:hypothetical protein